MTVDVKISFQRTTLIILKFWGNFLPGVLKCHCFYNLPDKKLVLDKELSALPFSCRSHVLGLLLLFIVEASLQESFKSHPFYKSYFSENYVIYINAFNYAPINCINCYLVKTSEKTISNPLSRSLRIPLKEGINPFIRSISKILFLLCLMHKNEYNKQFQYHLLLFHVSFGYSPLGDMTQIYLKPLTSTTQSVFQMLSRLGLDLKSALIFHGHPRSNKILRFL